MTLIRTGGIVHLFKISGELTFPDLIGVKYLCRSFFCIFNNSSECPVEDNDGFKRPLRGIAEIL